MRELYIAWGVIVCIIMISANSKGTYLFGAVFTGNGGYSSSGGYGRGWGYGSGGGFHK